MKKAFIKLLQLSREFRNFSYISNKEEIDLIVVDKIE